MKSISINYKNTKRFVFVLRSRLAPMITVVTMLAVAIVAAAVFAGEARAQTGNNKANIQNTDNKSDQTLRGNARVNPSTLGMEFSVAVGAYQGRNGGSIPVVFNYSSKVWQIKYADSARGFTMTLTDLQPSYAERSVAGWTSSLGAPWIEYPSDYFTDKGAPYPIDEPPPNSDTPQLTKHYVKRVFVHSADGGTHEFRKDDSVHPYDLNVGMDRTGTFLSVDGTRMRLELAADRSAVLFMPDGSRYLFGAYTGNNGIQHFASTSIDRNGNKMSYDRAARQWTDTMGRAVTDPMPIGSGVTHPGVGVQTVPVPGMTGQPARENRLVWAKLKESATNTVLLNPADELRYMGQSQCNGNSATGLSPYLFATDSNTRVCGAYGTDPANAVRFNPVVLSEIILPNGSKYKFKYNIHGEIVRIDYPTGGYEQFRYDFIQGLDGSMKQVYEQSNRGVLERWVNAGDGSPEQHWQYGVSETNGYSVTTTAPNGIRSVQKLVPSNSAHPPEYGDFGFADPSAGGVYEEQTYDSAGSLKTRQITFRQYSPPLAGGDSRAIRDGRVKEVMNITFEPDGATTKAIATMTQMSYDSNADSRYFASLNNKSVKTYKYKVVDATAAAAATFDYTAVAGQFADPGDVQNTSETDYIYDANYLARSILGLASETRTKNSAGAVISRMQMEYDEPIYLAPLVGGAPTGWENPGTSIRGLATTMKAWDTSANGGAGGWMTTRAKYDQFGNVTEATDARGNVSKSEYSATYNYAYPTKMTTAVPGGNGSAEPFTTTMTYDFNAVTRQGSGLPLTTTDANGKVTTMEYADALLRPTATVKPDGSRTEMTYADTAGAVSVKMKSQIDASNWAESTSYADGLGRTVKAKKKDAVGDVWTETKYDNMGRAFKSSNPYRTGTAEADKLWTTSEFDVAGRMNKVTSPDGSQVTTAYALSTTASAIGTVVTVTDQAGKLRRSITNALGQLVRVDEPDTSSASGDLGTLDAPKQATSYLYDGLGNLTSVVQGGQTRTFAYDSLSRLRTATNPESGSIGYTYDAGGNLLTKTDARNVTTNYAYDALNRVTSRSYNAPAGLANYAATSNVTYTYDDLSVPNSKGKLTRVSSAVSTTSYTNFDAMGRVKSSSQATDNTSYAFKYEYNLAGALTSETYPSGRTVVNAFDADGALSSVSGRRGDGAGNGVGAGKLFAASFDYTAAGGVSSMRLGNGRWESTVFNSRLQPTQIALGATKSATDLLKINYDYGEATHNNNGNVLSQTITVQTVGANQGFVATQSYTYDSLNRIKDAKELINSSQTWKQTFVYDRFGNRQFDMLNGATTMPSIATGGTTQQINPTVDVANNRFTSGQGYTYDLSGNLVTDANNRSFTYDGENKQTLVTNGSGTIGTYFYDGDGQRVKKIDGTTGEVTTFVYDVAGKLSAEYTNAANTATQPVTSYLTNDTLGSPRIITDNAGKVTSRRDFLPFGDDLATSQRTSQLGYAVNDTTRQKFTGYQKDTESGLDFAQARMYGSVYGRFTSPDDFINDTHLVDPQSWNLYSYGRNNPLVFVDPTGKTIMILYTETDSDGNKQRKSVQYRNGKLYSEGSDGKQIVYTGSNAYALKVRDDLNNIKSLDSFVGYKITTLEKSENTHQITETNKYNQVNGSGEDPEYSPNAQNGVGTGSVIFYDAFKDTDVNGESRPALIGLTHEISHSFDYDQGEDSDRNDENGVSYVEARATRLENRVRDKMGLTLRINRGDKAIDPYLLEKQRTFNDKVHKSLNPD